MQVRFMAFWMSLRAPVSSFIESSSQRVEEPFFVLLYGFLSFFVSLSERRSFASLANTSWKVILSGLMRLLLTNFFWRSLDCLVGRVSVRYRVFEYAFLVWKVATEALLSRLCFCFLPELALLRMAGFPLKLSFVYSRTYFPIWTYLSGERQTTRWAFDFFLKNLDSWTAWSFFCFSIIENKMI